MKIALCVNRDIHANVALNHLVEALSVHEVSIFFSEHVGRAPRNEALDVLRLIEQDIPNEHLFPLIETPGELMSFEAMGRRHGFSLETLVDPNAPDAIERLGALDLDLVLSIRYGRIFKDELIALPSRGVLNLHSGILPDYRGVLATFRALLAGAEEIGCTLHFIDDATIDTGRIVDEVRLPVDPESSLFGHVLSLYEPGAALIRGAIERLARGERLHTRPQPLDEGAYFTYPTEDEMAAFEKTGFPIFRASEYRELLRRYKPSLG